MIKTQQGVKERMGFIFLYSDNAQITSYMGLQTYERQFTEDSTTNLSQRQM